MELAGADKSARPTNCAESYHELLWADNSPGDKLVTTAHESEREREGNASIALKRIRLLSFCLASSL